jgi:tRNA threonylcarbamoyl adenosine modification protein YeaZ
MTASDDGLVLALDTSTRTSVVVLGGPERTRLLAESRRVVGHHHGSRLLEQLDEVLAGAGAHLEDVSSVAVGIGPGSFTGLRVGLATAKTLAHVRQLRLVGLASTDALRSAATAAGAPADVAILLPAGAHDHYLAMSGAPARLVPPGGLADALGATAVASVDGPLPSVEAADRDQDAARLGEAAVAGLPAALLALACDRLAVAATDDVALLVPGYVALPRGIDPLTQESAWSPDLR